MNKIDHTQSALQHSFLWISCLGAARGVCVHTIIYPLEVIKTHQQCQLGHQAEMAYKIAHLLFKREGISVFYRGLSFQLLKTTMKQAWVWPIISKVPPQLKEYQIKEQGQMAITGLLIATIDAFLTTPLEKVKILSITSSEKKASLKNMYKKGWGGLTTHWAKLSVLWPTFLVTQNALRKRSLEQSKKEKLNVRELTSIGIQVAIVVSLVSAPFDRANTLKQALDQSQAFSFSKINFKKSFQGWPLSIFILSIHNIASVILIDKLCSFNDCGTFEDKPVDKVVDRK